MKKAFQGMLIIFLAYTFLSCPVLTRVSFADETGYMPSPWQQVIARFSNVSSFIRNNLSDWIQDYIIPPKTSSDVQANKEKRKEIIEGIRDAWHIVFGIK